MHGKSNSKQSNQPAKIDKTQQKNSAVIVRTFFMHLSLVYITMVQFLLIILFLTHPIIVPHHHCYNLSLLFLLIYNIIITNYHSCWCQIKDWHLLSP